MPNDSLLKDKPEDGITMLITKVRPGSTMDWGKWLQCIATQQQDLSFAQ